MKTIGIGLISVSTILLLGVVIGNLHYRKYGDSNSETRVDILRASIIVAILIASTALTLFVLNGGIEEYSQLIQNLPE